MGVPSLKSLLGLLVESLPAYLVMLLGTGYEEFESIAKRENNKSLLVFFMLVLMFVLKLLFIAIDLLLIQSAPHRLVPNSFRRIAGDEMEPRVVFCFGRALAKTLALSLIKTTRQQFALCLVSLMLLLLLF